MGKKKKSNAKKGGNRFFRWIRSDLPDEEDNKSPVLLLGVNKIESPFVRRRSSDGAHTSGSIRFFRPPKSKYTRGHHGDERLEKIRQDLLTHSTHKSTADRYIPNDRSQALNVEEKRKVCIEFDCVGNCACKRHNSINRGSFSLHRPNRQSSLCPSEPYGPGNTDCSENDIEFKYKEHIPDNQPSSSKQSSYNVTPKCTERRSLLLANLNERFRKTLSLDSRKVETNRIPLSLPKETRPKSLINTANLCVQPEEPFVTSNFSKSTQPKKKRKSFFSLDTFFDKKSDSSSVDDYCSSKYKRFELDSDESPLFRTCRDKTPDLLKLPVIIDSVSKRKGDTRRQLEKLENHFYKSLKVSKTVIDAIPKDAKDVQGPSGLVNHTYDDDEVEYIEPIRSNFTSQSTLILDKNIPHDLQKPDSILTINTEETDIRLPSSTVSPKSGRLDLDSLGAYEIEVKESDLLVDHSKHLTVKIMDKSVDSIGSCSLDVDASTDFSDTTSGSLNLLTPSSTTSRIRDFTSRLQERANPIPTPAPNGIPAPKPHKYENHLKPPPKVVVNETHSHRSRGHKKREEHKKPSYLNLACSVNGYTNLTTYDSKLRQDINRSREASPIRPITHTYQYRTENNSLLVPVPVSANKLLVPTFEPHDTRSDLTSKAPSKALTDPHLASSPPHVYMANENKQLKNDFLGASMTTAARAYVSTESETFSSTMLQEDELDNVKEIKSSYSETNFRKANGQRTDLFSSESYTISSNEAVTNWSERTKKETLNSESYTISSNGVSKRVEITKENGEKLTSPMKSFIQQRVERLYGPGALAQGFFNQKRHKTKSQCDSELDKASDTLISPKSSCEIIDVDYSSQESDLSLPVLRHLRPEFRAQLPILSPKKSPKAEVEKKDIPRSPKKIDVRQLKTDPVPVESDIMVNGFSVLKLVNTNSDDSVTSVNGVRSCESVGAQNGCAQTSDVVKDGHYFLVLEKEETERLLALAATAEKELEDLHDKEVSEEVLGFLRSAAGKARLLATQKMQQFEGLCYNNINERADEPFPTTAQDLQGFWDMVCLQVKNVDALYEHMALLKANNWKEIIAPVKKPQSTPPSSRAPRPVVAPPARNTKAKMAAEKREADRKAMLEHRRRVARERQMAAKSSMPGSSHEAQQDMGIEGGQEVEIFVGRNARPSTVAPRGDCSSTTQSNTSLIHES